MYGQLPNWIDTEDVKCGKGITAADNSDEFDSPTHKIANMKKTQFFVVDSLILSECDTFNIMMLLRSDKRDLSEEKCLIKPQLTSASLCMRSIWTLKCLLKTTFDKGHVVKYLVNAVHILMFFSMLI